MNTLYHMISVSREVNKQIRKLPSMPDIDFEF